MLRKCGSPCTALDPVDKARVLCQVSRLTWRHPFTSCLAIIYGTRLPDRYRCSEASYTRTLASHTRTLASHTRTLSCSNDQSGANWLDAPGGKRDHEEFNGCVAGEPVSVAVQIRNPLSIKLRISGVRLVCEFTPEEGSAALRNGTSESLGTAAPSTAPELAAETLNPLAADSPRDNDPLGRTTPLRPKNQFVGYTGTLGGGGCARFSGPNHLEIL